MTKLIATGACALLLAATTGVVSAEAASSAKKYANCTALNKAYPHGVGRTGAVDHVTSGTRVTTFTRNNAVYKANAASDRDKDKIACEKK